MARKEPEEEVSSPRSSSSTRPTTGFFDLPLEIRQQIYTDLIPPDLTIHWDGAYCSAGRIIEAACDADPRINAELRDWIEPCLMYKFTLAPRCPLPFPEIAYDRLRAIDILIDHYDISDRRTEVRAFRQNIARFVAMFQRFDRLPILSVKFHQEATLPSPSDEHWCYTLLPPEDEIDLHGAEGDTDFSSRGSLEYGDFLYTLRQDGPTIVEYLLSPLVDLPVCDGAIIEEIYTLEFASDAWADAGYEERCGVEYMFSRFLALARWLQGERDKPFSDLIGWWTHDEKLERAWRVQGYLV